jgi:hypothetical protein
MNQGERVRSLMLFGSTPGLKRSQAQMSLGSGCRLMPLTVHGREIFAGHH